MKNFISLFATLLVVAVFSLGVNAQESQEKIKQKELQKKQQEELKRQQKELDSISEKAKSEYEDELKQLFEEQRKQQAESKELNNQIFIRGDRSSGRSSSRSVDRHIYFPFTTFSQSSGDNTTFTISKRIDESLTFTGDFEYEVPENVTGLYFDFGSELDAGSLKITISKPGGKVFQTFSVAPVANVDWNKKVQVKEGEAKDYSGTWKITISTKDAKGYYELRINSY